MDLVKVKVRLFAPAAVTTALFFTVLVFVFALTEGRLLRSTTPFTDDIISTEIDLVLEDAAAILFAVAVLIMFAVVVAVVFMGFLANFALPNKIGCDL